MGSCLNWCHLPAVRPGGVARGGPTAPQLRLIVLPSGCTSSRARFLTGNHGYMLQAVCGTLIRYSSRTLTLSESPTLVNCLNVTLTVSRNSRQPLSGPAAHTPMVAKSNSNNAGIVAGVVIGVIAFVSILSIGIIWLRRRRRRTPILEAASRAPSERSLNRKGKSASEGSSPLLVTPLVWPHHDLEESIGSGTGTLPRTSETPVTSEYSPGVAGVGAAGGFSHLRPNSHSQGFSDNSATPLMQTQSQDLSNSDAYYYHPVPFPSQNRGVKRTPTGDTIASSYSQESASTHAYHELERARSLSSPPPMPILPPQLQLPHIAQTEPMTDVGDLLKSRAAATSALTRSGRLDTDAFSPRSQSSRKNTLSLGSSLSRSGGLRNKYSASKSRTAFTRAPMEPVMEQEFSKPAVDTPIHDRWSVAADPGGSRPRLPRSQSQPAPDSVSRPSSSGSRENQTTFGYGMSLLTSAFRKSLSASSTTTQRSSSISHGHHSDPGHGGGGTAAAGALSGYPSMTSIGGSSTGSFYTAVSDVGTSSRGGAGGRKPKKKGGSSMRTSLASYPSIPSLPSSVAAGRGHKDLPPVPPVPPLPTELSSSGLLTVPASATKSNNTAILPSPNSGSNSSPMKPKAHLRKVPDPHTRSESERDVPRLVRAGVSSHGVVGLVEGQK